MDRVQGRSLVSTIERVVLEPTFTSPKEMLEGEASTESLPNPMPATANCNVEFDAVLVTVISPLVNPTVGGLKVTFSPTLCPALSSTGKFNPETVNSEPLTPIAEMLMLL